MKDLWWVDSRVVWSVDARVEWWVESSVGVWVDHSAPHSAASRVDSMADQ